MIHFTFIKIKNWKSELQIYALNETMKRLEEANFKEYVAKRSSSCHENSDPVGNRLGAVWRSDFIRRLIKFKDFCNFNICDDYFRLETILPAWLIFGCQTQCHYEYDSLIRSVIIVKRQFQSIFS